MNGIGDNDDRSYVYDSLPSIPHWAEPVAYQISGDFSITLPPGTYRISLEHGNEFIPIKEEFVIARGGEATKTFTMRRWIDLPARGWFSGDVHVHHPTTKQAFKDFLWEYARAEDVHLVNVLEMGHHLGTDFKQEGFGEKFRTCKDNICLVSGQEDPRSTFGHIIGLNIEQMVRDTKTYNYYDLAFEKLKLQPGAIVGYAHFSWNGCDLPRGFPWYITTEQIDFVELLQFSRINTMDYYDYLNLGFRITAAAGSDIPRGSTLGEVRTFVFTGNTFSADSWFEGLKKGHTFVSNGPALFLEADGSLPGTEITRSKGSITNLSVKALSHASIGMIERVLVYNNDGLVVEKLNPQRADSIEIDLAHTLLQSQWLSAVVYCDNGAVAHTTPIYFVIDGQPTWHIEKAPNIIVKQLAAIQSIEEETRAMAEVDEGIITRLEEAKAFYAAILSTLRPN
ncbi:MAG: CehA/McbA family metallohydrolase [Saprospiraceae bacterium]|nr:CehA/McbA family metallohydrolase [Saprospiraceae bacterium]